MTEVVYYQFALGAQSTPGVAGATTCSGVSLGARGFRTFQPCPKDLLPIHWQA
jgi:hypothetical protein